MHARGTLRVYGQDVILGYLAKSAGAILKVLVISPETFISHCDLYFLATCAQQPPIYCGLASASCEYLLLVSTSRWLVADHLLWRRDECWLSWREQRALTIVLTYKILVIRAIMSSIVSSFENETVIVGECGRQDLERMWINPRL